MAVGAGTWLGVMLSSPLVPTGDSELISQTEEMAVVTKDRSFFCWYLTCHPSLLSCSAEFNSASVVEVANRSGCMVGAGHPRDYA